MSELLLACFCLLNTVK